MRGTRAAVAVVAAHYAANLVHGVAHQGVPVPLTTLQTVFVVLVVGVAPLLSLWLLREGRTTAAWTSLAVFLMASLVFGLVFHYILDTVDHVANVPAGFWHGPFVGTAALVALADGAGVIVSLWYARRSGAQS